MRLHEPELVFVPIAGSSIVTVSCADTRTDGGTYCVNSFADETCGTKMWQTGNCNDGLMTINPSCPDGIIA